MFAFFNSLCWLLQIGSISWCACDDLTTRNQQTKEKPKEGTNFKRSDSNKSNLCSDNQTKKHQITKKDRKQHEIKRTDQAIDPNQVIVTNLEKPKPNLDLVKLIKSID